MATLFMITGALWLIVVAVALLVAMGCYVMDQVEAIWNARCEAAMRRMANRLLQDSYWFTEHMPTARLLRKLAEDIITSGASDVAHVREEWRADCEAERHI